MEDLVGNNNLSFYRNKKVFLTGHTGFKGAWLMAWLHKLGAIVKGYSLPPDYENGLFDILKPMQLADSVLADIRDKERLKNEIRSFQPDMVFHLAAQPLVRRSYQIPAETFEINVAGTANLLEAVISLPSKCSIVVITTDKVYENIEEDILYNENSLLGGYDPYSASKACTELVVGSFRSSFFNPLDFQSHEKAIASARAGNVIGGGDWSRDRIVPDIVRSLQSEEEIVVRNPPAIRPWQHVLEPLHGYLILGALLYKDARQFSSAYNFGPLPEDHLTVKQLVEKAIASWGSGKWKDASAGKNVHEAGILKLDIKKAMTELAWKPKLSAEEAIEWTINWYKQDEDSRGEYCFEQINSFQSL